MATNAATGARAAAPPRRRSTRASKAPISADPARPGFHRPGTSVVARLFDADHTDRVVDVVEGMAGTIPDRCLLWVDVTGKDPVASSGIVELLGLEAKLAAESGGPPLIEIHGDWFQVRVAAITSGARRERALALDIVAAPNIVLTVHPAEIPFLADIDERLMRDTALGEIDSTSFVAVVLDGLVTSYLATADELEADVYRLDQEALRPTTRRDLLADLVQLRHRIAEVRRELTNHREVFAALARADFEKVNGQAGSSHLRAVAERFERAIDAVERTREALVGTFDIHATRTSQRTNEIVKVLTIVSVMLLPTTVIAGIMGMNIKAPYSIDDPTIFWIVVIVIATIAIGTLAVLRQRHWI